MNSALHKNKSTDNSRLIVALSSIGKDATSVGDWDLVEAYSANGFDWIKKQGINGAIWALIALDTNNYATTGITIRQQCNKNQTAVTAAVEEAISWLSGYQLGSGDFPYGTSETSESAAQVSVALTT